MAFYSFDINIDKQYEVYRHQQRKDNTFSKDTIITVASEAQARAVIDELVCRKYVHISRKCPKPIDEVFKEYTE